MLSPDYQQFELTDRGIQLHGQRMAQKLKALKPLNLDFTGKTVLDVGCDHGFWCFYASEQGASEVLGVDRGRHVKSRGYVDLIELNKKTAASHGYDNVDFMALEIGKEWIDLGPFNVVLLMSLYHHVYQNVGGDHKSIWYWLWRQTNDVLLWENPVDAADAVVQANVDKEYHPNYTKEKLLEAASEWFDLKYSGPAEHEPYREVWLLKRKDVPQEAMIGKAVDGAGGASKAFLHDNKRRINEIFRALGFLAHPGSLNIVLEQPFDFDKGYYRVHVSDVVERGVGLDVPWEPRWARVYPVFAGTAAYAFRFEGEHYPKTFVELISPERLRDYIDPEYIELWR